MESQTIDDSQLNLQDGTYTDHTLEEIDADNTNAEIALAHSRARMDTACSEEEREGIREHIRNIEDMQKHLSSLREAELKKQQDFAQIRLESMYLSIHLKTRSDRCDKVMLSKHLCAMAIHSTSVRANRPQHGLTIRSTSYRQLPLHQHLYSHLLPPNERQLDSHFLSP